MTTSRDAKYIDCQDDSTQPIIGNNSDIFSDIVYEKVNLYSLLNFFNQGSSVLYMLREVLGDDTLQAGLRKYLRDFAFNTAVTADLWDALTAVILGSFNEEVLGSK